MSQVVHDYGDVCQAVTDLAVELDMPISTDDFRTLNRCLDDALAGAVTESGRERTQSDIDGESARGSVRLGFFAHEFEVGDECGALVTDDIDALFRPFQQRSADRTGVGLALAFSRSAAETNDGRICARSLPDEGCVFAVDLSRLLVSALAVAQS